MTVSWIPVLVSCALAFSAKLLGGLVPQRWLDRPVVARCVTFLPVALLSALVATSTVLTTTTAGVRFAIDARLAALVVAGIALLLRAPFIVVIVLAGATAAGIRALGWG